MDTYDLSVAFYTRLAALTYSGMKTLLPDEIFDATEGVSATTYRRGVVIGPHPSFTAFGHGVYSRVMGIYQIDLWVPRKTTSALKTIKQMADAHLAHFWPANGRGLTLTENSTSAYITARPDQTPMGREGAYLREMIEVEFWTEIHPS